MIDLLNQLPLAGLMLVVAVGYCIGRLQFRGMSIGPAGGTLALAILLGHHGVEAQAGAASGGSALSVGQFGFALFIYSVGFEAGPRFFSSLMGGPGWRFVVLGSMVNVFAVGLAVGMGLLFDLGESITAGLLSGSLTSAPTYAAAAEVTADTAGLAVSFALTYPIGLVGLVLMIQFLPRLMGDDLAVEAEQESTTRAKKARPELTRAFDVTEPGVVGRPLKDLDLTHATGCYITMVHRGGEVFSPTADTILELGDHVLAKGRLDELQVFGRQVGHEVYDEELRTRMPVPRRIVVLRRGVVGRTLGELDIARRHRCLITGIERLQVPIEPTTESYLHRGDIVEVVGRRGDLNDLAEELGRYQKPSNETDIAVYAAGILLGLLIGQGSLALPGVSLTLGTAGGLLLAGLLLGRFRTIGPITTHVPPAARQLVRDLGILLFVAETGLLAGAHSFAPWHDVLLPTLGAALAVTVLSVVLTVLLGRRLMRLRAVDTWGSVGGGMTSSASLVALRRAADSNAPAISYAAAYAVASVLTTMAGQIVVMLL